MNMVTKTTNKNISKLLNYNEEEIKQYALDYLLNNSTLSKLTEQQKNEFITMCIIHRLNPFKREIHASLYKEQLQIIVGYEVYIKRAFASGLLDGYVIEHDKSEPANPIAIIKIYRKGCTYPIVHSVVYKEYVQRTKEGQITKFWANKPRTMLEKVAISQGFRRAFPDVIDGLPYVSEEIEESETNTKVIEATETKVIKNEADSKITNINLDEAKELFA